MWTAGLKNRESFDDYIVHGIDFEALASGKVKGNLLLHERNFLKARPPRTESRSSKAGYFLSSAYCEIGYAVSSVKDILKSSRSLKNIHDFVFIPDDSSIIPSSLDHTKEYSGVSMQAHLMNPFRSGKYQTLDPKTLKMNMKFTKDLHGITRKHCDRKDVKISIENSPQHFLFALIILNGLEILADLGRASGYYPYGTIPITAYSYLPRPSMANIVSVDIRTLMIDSILILREIFGAIDEPCDPNHVFQHCLWAKGPTMEKEALLTCAESIVKDFEANVSSYHKILVKNAIVPSDEPATNCIEWASNCILAFCINIHDPVDCLPAFKRRGSPSYASHDARVHSIFETAIDWMGVCSTHDMIEAEKSGDVSSETSSAVSSTSTVSSPHISIDSSASIDNPVSPAKTKMIFTLHSYGLTYHRDKTSKPFKAHSRMFHCAGQDAAATIPSVVFALINGPAIVSLEEEEDEKADRIAKEEKKRAKHQKIKPKK
ncbi:hypothetical protein ADUPG1_008677 [Aduncisulcus paluster]|uniref:Uncharacterized protein n=1 Tax=Aduncisulcus paluster TaxID=2918883 RepID=A0ABQ5KV53_9EUKA|nr:hypothetical protein ADUPG1_008677 [Aduncisulcus paluster]